MAEKNQKTDPGAGKTLLQKVDDVKWAKAIKDGAVKGFTTGIMLLRIMLPIYILVVLLKYSPIMPFLQRLFAPAMKWFNMPGEAAVPIITGMFTEEYSAIAAMGGFSFNTATITTIAMIVLCCHSLPVESAVSQKIGFPAGKIALLRFLMAIVTGLICGWLGGIFL